MEQALDAAKKYKADGGRQLAYGVCFENTKIVKFALISIWINTFQCQLQLAGMLEATTVRQKREQNIIYGQNYMVNPPKRVIELLQSCLDASLGRTQLKVSRLISNTEFKSFDYHSS